MDVWGGIQVRRSDHNQRLTCLIIGCQRAAIVAIVKRKRCEKPKMIGIVTKYDQIMSLGKINYIN